MARDTVAQTWTPGDPVLFAPAAAAAAPVMTKSASSSSSGSSKRAPLGSVRAGKQTKDTAIWDEEHKRRHYQSTLSPWKRSAWQPGMPVEIARPKRLASSTSTKGSDSSKSSSSSSKASSRFSTEMIPTSRHSSDAYTEKQYAGHPEERHTKSTDFVPFKCSNIYDDDVTSRDHNYHSVVELGDSPSSIKAIDGNASHLLDPDSSIEFLGEKPGEKSSPMSNAMRHFALGQAHLEEARRMNEDAIRMKAHPAVSSSPFLSQVQSCIASTSARAYSSFPSPRPTNLPASSKRPSWQHASISTKAANPLFSAHVDWDDPVINPTSPQGVPETSYDSSDSDLPELAMPPKRAVVQPTASTIPSSKSVAAQSPTIQPSLKAVSKVELKKLQAEGRKQKKEAKIARELKKQAKSDQLKSQLLQFSYDQTSSTTPKVWYYQGCRNDETAFIGCDTRQGFSKECPKELEEVVGSLKGPLGWDLEWESMVWNETFTSKIPGKVALIQLGDRHNIVLYQVGKGGSIPACIANTLRDKEVIKLGVQIKGDARKLHRDYRDSNDQSIESQGLLDLSDLAKHIHPTTHAHVTNLISMQALTAKYLDRYLDKGETRTSRWGSNFLDASQRKYAANDVYASVLLYHRIIGHAECDNIAVDFESLINDLALKPPPSQDVVFLTRRPRIKRQGSEPKIKTDDGGAVYLPPRVLEAWTKWHVHQLDGDALASAMNIKFTSVVSYILKALATDRALPYDAERLQSLTKDVYMSAENHSFVRTLSSQAEIPARQ